MDCLYITHIHPSANVCMEIEVLSIKSIHSFPYRTAVILILAVVLLVLGGRNARHVVGIEV